MFFYILEQFVCGMSMGQFYSICKEKKDREIRERRTRRAVQMFYKVLYYLSAFLFGLYVVHDLDYVPVYMLGTGDLTKLYEGWTPQQDRYDFLKHYYMITNGYHMLEIFKQVRDNKLKSFEPVFNHILTVFLNMFSYMSNLLNVGIIIFFLHDWFDLLINAYRTLNETVYLNLCKFCFLLAMIVFLYSRLIVFPIVIVMCFIKRPKLEPDISDQFGYVLTFLCIFLITQLLMHGYWVFYVTRAILQFEKPMRTEESDIDVNRVR